MNAGEDVDPHKYGFQMHVFLETGDEKYRPTAPLGNIRDWGLNKAIGVGRVAQSVNGIIYDAYKVVTVKE